MKIALQLEQIDLSFLQNMWQGFIEFLPKLITVIAVLIIGWICIKIITYSIKKALKFSKVDVLAEKLNSIDIIKESKFELKPINVIVKVVKWILIFIIIIVVSEILQLRMVSEGISNLIAYLPKLFSAIAILLIGIYIADMLKKSIQSAFKSFNLGGSKAIGNIVFFAITIIIGITALNQAGIDTEMITSNLTIILGALLLAFTIAFGLGSKEIVQRLLFGFYSRKNLIVGQRIRIGEVEGIINSIDNIYLVLQNNEGKFIFPIKEVNEQIIQVYDTK